MCKVKRQIRVRAAYWTRSGKNLTTEFGDHSVFFPEHVLKRESLFQLPLFGKKKNENTLFLISMLFFFFNIKGALVLLKKVFKHSNVISAVLMN